MQELGMNMFKTGNTEFKVFFESFFIPICRFIGKYTEEKEVVDIAQEVFVKVYEKWKEFDSSENARAFLYTSARNLCLDFIKHKKAESHYLSEFARQDIAADPVFLKEVTRQETFRILHAAIDCLPPQSQQIIQLCMEGLSNAEVGEKLGISVNTVKTLKKNAYFTLRRLLSKEYLVLLLILLGDFQV